MTKKQKEAVITALERALAFSSDQWRKGDSERAYTIGYLEQAIKTAIYDIQAMKN